jgi:hypothetical protein
MAAIAFAAYIHGMSEAGIAPNRVVQTIGDAPASAHFHLQDGVDSAGHDYCAALDLSVRHPDVLDSEQIQSVLDGLADHGFIGWYRPWGADSHIHVVFCGVRMKVQLRDQVHEWFDHRDGLADHGFDNFFMPTLEEGNICRALFLDHNPMNG